MPEESDTKGNLTFGKVVSGGFWMYLDTIVVSVVGYIYWFLIGTVGGPSIIGFASATISLAAIIMTTISLGIPVGIQRFLGKAFGENNFADLKKYFISAFFLVFVISLLVVIALFFVKNYFSLLLNIADIYIILAGALVFFNGLNTTLKSLFISILKIDKIFYIDATSTVARLLGGLYLVYLGFGGIGATLGFVFAGSVSFALYGSYAILIFRKIRTYPFTISIEAIRSVLEAGSVNWLPTLITTFGVQLGLLILFGNQGSYETGIYYISYAIFAVLVAFPNAFLALLFPILSGLKQGHTTATRRTLNLVLSASVPLAAVLATYSSFVLGLMGSAYLSGWLLLSILSLSVPLVCVVNGVTSLVYALGKYRQVLGIGLAASVLRVILYFYLVPIYGSLGTAISLDMGFVAAFFVAVYYAKLSKLYFRWRDFGLTTALPFGLGFMMWYFAVPWYLGSVVILALSIFIFARAKLYTKADIRDISLAVLPDSIVKKIAPKAYPILEFLFGE